MDAMHLPEGLDRQLVIDNILIETAELSIVYSKPDTFKFMLDRWSAAKNLIWTQLYQTMLYDYNPIANYDRWEETVHRNDHTDSGQKRDGFSNSGGYNDSGETGYEDNGRTDTNNKVDLQHDIYGFNNPAPAHSWDEHTTSKADETVKNTGKSTTKLDNTHTEQGRSGQNTANQSVDFDAGKSHMYGNIGVTTTQQMIQAQRDVVQFDIIAHIVRDFKKQFCLGIY